MINSLTHADRTSQNLPQSFIHVFPNPRTPWIPGPDLMNRMQQEPPISHGPYKKCVLIPSDPEYKFILRYFLYQKPPGHGIAQISYTYNPRLVAGFEAELVNMDFEAQNSAHLPDWVKEEPIESQKKALKRWKCLTDEFSSIKLKESSSLLFTNILPLWKGTSPEESPFICTSGISCYSDQSNRVDSPYGKGIHFTNSPDYASRSCRGTLLLSWVSMREPFPVVSGTTVPQIGSGSKLLQEQGSYKRYNAYYIPLTPFQCDEIVVFDRSQILPCFLIELSTDLPRSIPLANCFSACETGDLKELQDLIKHDLNLIKIRQNNGQNLLHIAIAAGHVDVVQWIYTLDPSLVDLPDQAWQTPLHLAILNQARPIVELFLDKINDDLLLQMVEKPCAEVLSLVLQSSNRSNISNRFKQTLLHQAAQAGCEENVICLLKYGALVNAQDLSNKTPLFLAAKGGCLSIVKLLINSGADLQLISIEGETVLHAAALHNQPNLVEYLLFICPSMIHTKDKDEETPLHKAVTGTTQKISIVKLLLDNNADVNAKSDNRNTPLHLAAKHGHYESAALLVQKGAEVTAKNIDLECPFDLAIHRNHNDLIHSFLETKQRLEKVEEPQNDLEGHYYKRLLQAKKENLVEEQILYLEKLSNVYFQKKDFFGSAKILNATLALLQGKKPFYEKYLLAKLETIDLRFLEDRGVLILHHESKEYIKGYRSTLKDCRVKCKNSFESNKPIGNILQELTQRYQQLLAIIISDAMQLIGPAPVKWACIGMGSMARGEMCPFSDLEFAFLIEHDTEEALKYFRLLAEVVALRVINIGETEFPILGNDFPSPTISGYRLDSGGNTPLGMPNIYELIGTPEQMAQFQTEHWIESNIILANAMSTVRQISGEKRLVDNYLKEKSKIAKKNGHHTQFAIRLLKGHLTEFCSKPYFLEELPEIIGIKKQLYRPFQEILSSLAIYFDLEKCGTLERIDELVSKQIFSKEAGENLKNALQEVLSLRLEAHLFYQNETEFLYFPRAFVQGQKLFCVKEKQESSLENIARVLAPFSLCVQEFIENQQADAFQHSLYEENETSKVYFQYRNVQIQQPKLENIPKDKEQYYLQNFLQSVRSDFVGGQIFYLEQTGDIYLQKNDFAKAAKILNTAFALVHESSTILKKSLLIKMDSIERLFVEKYREERPFLEKYGIHQPKNILYYRNLLNEARQSCKASQESVITKLQDLTQAFKIILAELITDCQKRLGSPPVSWACIGMGSMARGEMCLYSDIEFAFLIEKKSEKALDYFVNLSRLLELRIINLGETAFPIFEQWWTREVSPILNGFSMDSGGLTPLGNGLYELIDTPQGLAQWQCERRMDENIILANALTTTCHVTGDERLICAYNTAKKEAQSQTDGAFSFSGTPFYKKLALKLLQGDLLEFKPDLSNEKEQIKAFGCKGELYRPLQSMLNVLAIFYRLDYTSTPEIIKRLLQKGILSSKGASNLTRALSLILTLRLEAQTFYQGKNEILVQVEHGELQNPDYFYLDSNHLTTLEEIYRVLMPLQRCGENFLATNETREFTNAILYDDKFSTQGESFCKTRQYSNAQEAYQNAVSLNPNDFAAHLHLGEMEEKLGRSQEALSRFLKALALAEKKNGDNHLDIAICYTNIGKAYYDLCEYEEAFEFQHKKKLLIQNRKNRKLEGSVITNDQ